MKLPLRLSCWRRSKKDSNKNQTALLERAHSLKVCQRHFWTGILCAKVSAKKGQESLQPPMCIWKRASALLTSILVKWTLSLEQNFWCMAAKRLSASMRLRFCLAYPNACGLSRTKASRQILIGSIATWKLYLFYKSISFQLMSRPQISSSALDVFSNGIISQFWSLLLTSMNWSFRWLFFIKTGSTKTIYSILCTNIFNIQSLSKANPRKQGPN